MPKLIAVCGATGNQGTSLSCVLSSQFTAHVNPLGGAAAKILLQYPEEYSVRALTRDPQSPAAQALAEAGAEVVRADLTSPNDLASALEGCWGVFGVTNFYDPVCPLLRLHQLWAVLV